MKASKITILYALIPHLTINSVIPQIESFFFGLFVLWRERSNAKIERGKKIEVSMSLMS